MNQVDNYERQLSRLKQHIKQNAGVFREYAAILRTTEEAFVVANTAMSERAPLGPFEAGCFRREASAGGHTYDASKLPLEVLKQPGVVKTVDAKLVANLLIGPLAEYASASQKARFFKARKAAVKCADRVPQLAKEFTAILVSED